VAAVSYLTTAIFLGWRPTFAGGASLLSPQKAVFDYALEFVIGGFVAGIVAIEIRKQVDAALREAETRLQVDRMEYDLEGRDLSSNLCLRVPCLSSGVRRSPLGTYRPIKPAEITMTGNSRPMARW
jgi:hypothetical protein